MKNFGAALMCVFGWVALLVPACDDPKGGAGSDVEDDSDVEARMTDLRERECRFDCDIWAKCKPDALSEVYGNVDRCYGLCAAEKLPQRINLICEKKWETYLYSSLEQCRTTFEIDSKAYMSVEGCQAACEISERWFDLLSSSKSECLETCASLFTESCSEAYSDILVCYEEKIDCDSDWYFEYPCKEADIDWRTSCGLGFPL